MIQRQFLIPSLFTLPPCLQFNITEDTYNLEIFQEINFPYFFSMVGNDSDYMIHFFINMYHIQFS